MTQPCFLFAYFDFLIQVISVDILLALHDILVYCKRDTNTLKLIRVQEKIINVYMEDI